VRVADLARARRLKEKKLHCRAPGPESEPEPQPGRNRTRPSLAFGAGWAGLGSAGATWFRRRLGASAAPAASSQHTSSAEGRRAAGPAFQNKKRADHTATKGEVVRASYQVRSGLPSVSLARQDHRLMYSSAQAMTRSSVCSRTGERLGLHRRLTNARVWRRPGALWMSPAVGWARVRRRWDDRRLRGREHPDHHDRRAVMGYW